MTAYGYGTCGICGKHEYLRPLHGDKGGPLCCLLCVGEWHGEHGRRLKLGRIAIRALAAYLEGGGKIKDIDAMKATVCASSWGVGLDPLEYMVGRTEISRGENIDLTSELLDDILKLTHPDQHPPERRELANRVTQQLLELQPFVFPKPKPNEMRQFVGGPDPAKASSDNAEPTFPCPECAGSLAPFYYCDACRAGWKDRQRKEREAERAKQRQRYAQRKAWRAHATAPKVCATCGDEFNGKREDARFCSDACRQTAHRKGVTATSTFPYRSERSVTVGAPLPEPAS
jgi:hypothetical protein